jgi:hypothetical protein
MNESIGSVCLTVLVQENGIIRSEPSGLYLGQLEGIEYKNLQTLADEHSRKYERFKKLEKIKNAAELLLTSDRSGPLSRDERVLMSALYELPEYNQSNEEGSK